MNLPPAESGIAAVAVACPRCHAAVAVPSALFGQASACPVCSGGFIAPIPSPAPLPPQSLQPGQPQAPHFQTAQPQAVPIESAPPVVPGLQPASAADPPPMTVRRGNETIELRRLTPEEKALRRIRRTIITIGAGTAVLFAIVLAVNQIEQMKKSEKQRR